MRRPILQFLNVFLFCLMGLAVAVVSGPESFRASWPNGVGNDSAAALPLEELKRLYQVSETLSSLNFASRARNAMLSLGNRDTIKKWRDVFENIMLADKHKIEKEQNAQLRNQLAQLAQLEQAQKLQIQQQDSTIQSLQAKIRSLEHELNEALHSSETKSKSDVDSGLEVQSLLKAISDTMDSSIVTKKLEEELKNVMH
ncbi:hypothetical protein ACJRO7_034172 [Eucalyptus globulus]|uniref:Uncharacterized protein n=1 Tax=Eucalyptus globulus TaxID=34317 RepID=A0ABD3J5S3_EUCGL